MKNDPAHYREISKPFATVELANKALADFFEDVKAVRDKHKIADVVVLAMISHVLDGEEVRGEARASMGDSNNVVPMLAGAYGAEQVLYEERLKLITANARKRPL